MSVVGNDYHAQTIKNLLKNEHVNFELIQDSQRPTTVKSRIFARNQQIIRYDEEMIKPVSKTIRAALKHNLEKYLEQHNAVILSDYGKGLLYQNLIEDIYETAKKMKCAAPKIFIDPKPQNKSFYKNAFLLTPNAKETQELAGVCMKTSKEIKKTAKMLLKELKAENLLITLGAEGMVYFSKKKNKDTILKVPQNKFLTSQERAIRSLPQWRSARLSVLKRKKPAISQHWRRVLWLKRSVPQQSLRRNSFKEP